MTSSAESPIAARTSLSRFPDFFIVGHPKSGTTALYEMLRRHPQIFMPVKEPSYFGPELPRSAARGLSERNRLEEYLSLFAAAAPEQRVGEATPSYLRSETAARRIAEVQPNARIIAILREPASFVRSLHLEFVQSHMEPEKDLRRALSLEHDRSQGRRLPEGFLPQTFLYADRIRYVEQLRRYHDAFAQEQVRVLIYEDFRRDNERTVRDVLRFLDVDDSVAIDAVEANPTVRLRSRRINDALLNVAVGDGAAARAASSLVKSLTPRPLRRRALRATRQRLLYAEPRPPDERMMMELRRRFKPAVIELSEYLGRDLLSLWGYAQVD
jgi:hypothetical protein